MDSLSFKVVKASSWLGPQAHTFFLLSRTVSGCSKSAQLRINLDSWLTMPTNRRTSATFWGADIYMIASVLAGSAHILLWSMMCPKNFSCVFDT